MEGKMQFAELTIKNKYGMYRNKSLLNNSFKISHNFQGIHDYIVNLWEFCVFNNSLHIPYDCQ